MAKKTITLNESELIELISRTVKTILTEVQNKQWTLLRCNEVRDKEEMCQWMSKQFDAPYEEIMGYLNDLQINWGLSVKALDSRGNTIGFLTMSDYNIEDETEQILTDAPDLLNELNQFDYVSGFSFIVAPEYRGSRLNYDMLNSIQSELDKKDFIFIPVQHHLRTHNYWRRFGAICFYQDDESKYYIIPKNERVKEVLAKYLGGNTEHNRID